MTHPKAKWTKLHTDAWDARVGPFFLDVDACTGRCRISEWRIETESIGSVLWQQRLPTPCDVPDLMHLTEAELARRLEQTAETVDGSGLVAPSAAEKFMDLGDGSKTSDDVFGDTPDSSTMTYDEVVEWADNVSASLPEPNFKVGDLVTVTEKVGCGTSDDFVPGQKLKVIKRDGAASLWHVFSPETDFRRVVSARILKPWHDEPQFKVGDRVMSFDGSPSRHITGTVAKYVAETEDYVVHLDDGTRLVCNTRHLVSACSLEPRFKIGDLVCVLWHDGIRVGAVTHITTDASGKRPLFSVTINGDVATYHPDGLNAYTLPPINSYADLADVLDELPEGWRVEQNFVVYGDRCRREHWRDADGTLHTRAGSVSRGCALPASGIEPPLLSKAT
jgi:hypothetical protein